MDSQVRLPSGDPTVTVYVDSGVLIQPGVVALFDDANWYQGVNCAAFWEIGNFFGYPFAQGYLGSGYCNTDGFIFGESTAEAFNAALLSGPIVNIAPDFQTWYASFAPSGYNVLLGRFDFCSENPLGQHSTYYCIQFDAGPFE